MSPPDLRILRVFRGLQRRWLGGDFRASYRWDFRGHFGVDMTQRKKPQVVVFKRLAACVLSGAEGTRTLDPRLAKPMLSQLSYGPPGQTGQVGRTPRACVPSSDTFDRMTGARERVGARRVELRTSSLSATRSNQLSYAPLLRAKTLQDDYSSQSLAVKPRINRACAEGLFFPIFIGRIPAAGESFLHVDLASHAGR